MCAKGDWQLFLDMLIQILNPEMAKKLGNNARKYAEEFHDINKIIKKYKKCFTKIVQG
jgi:glycosyltransferase involved in cell wall biosynthesis